MAPHARPLRTLEDDLDAALILKRRPRDAELRQARLRRHRERGVRLAIAAELRREGRCRARRIDRAKQANRIASEDAQRWIDVLEEALGRGDAVELASPDELEAQALDPSRTFTCRGWLCSAQVANPGEYCVDCLADAALKAQR